MEQAKSNRKGSVCGREHVTRLSRWWHTQCLRVRVQLYSVVFAGLLLVGCGVVYMMLVQRTLERQYRESLESYAGRLGTMVSVLGFDLTHLDTAQLERLRPLFTEPLLGEGTYPMVVYPSGKIGLHFFREGESFPMEVMELMAGAPNRKGTLRYYFSASKRSERLITYAYVPSLRCYLAVETPPDALGVAMAGQRLLVAGLLLGIVVFLLVLWISNYMGHRVTKTLSELAERLQALTRGERPALLQSKGSPELRALVADGNLFLEGLEAMENFVQAITAKQLDEPYQARGPMDTMGNSLLSLRENLRATEQETKLRRADEEQRNWTNRGLAEIATLLRERSEKLEELAYAIIEHLVGYLNAQQGSIYLFQSHEGEEGGEPMLRLVAAHAYDRRKYLEEEIRLGEGLVGTCARERATIHLDSIPEDYFWISSGVGGTPPRELLLVPLQTNEAFMGVVELASLKGFSPYMVEFVEALSMSIAQTFLSTRTAQQTRDLLEESQMRRGQLHAQEEEMRQNLEEMKATQEEMERNYEVSHALRRAIDLSSFYGELDEMGVLRHLNTFWRKKWAGVGIVEPEGIGVQERGYWYNELQGAYVSLEVAWQLVAREGELRGHFAWHGEGTKVLYVVGAFIRMEASGSGEQGVYFMGQEVRWSRFDEGRWRLRIVEERGATEEDELGEGDSVKKQSEDGETAV